MASFAEFQQPAKAPPHWDTASKQFDGIVVIDAFLNATFVFITSRLQGMVFKPTYWNDRR